MCTDYGTLEPFSASAVMRWLRQRRERRLMWRALILTIVIIGIILIIDIGIGSVGLVRY